MGSIKPVESQELEFGRDRHLGNTILNQLYRRRTSIDWLHREDSQLAASLERRSRGKRQQQLLGVLAIEFSHETMSLHDVD